jgi:proline iminopeptidase
LLKLLTPTAILLAALMPMTLSAQTSHPSGIVHTPEVDLAYYLFGAPSSQLPLIAVNGGPGLSHAYMVQNDLWQRAGAHRLVVLYDQRGTGASKHLQPSASQSMEAQVADLEALRAALKLDRFALLGDSYGGFLSMAYAAAHPEHVARLILSDSPPPAFKDMVHLLPQVFPDLEQSGEAEEKSLAANPEAAAQAGLVNHFRMIFYSPEKRDQYLAQMGDIGFVPQVGAAVSASAQTLDLHPQVAKFTFPTLVITGRYDMNVAPLNAWRMAHEIPNAKLVFFEQSGHLPAYEEPDKYLKVLEDFLSTP